MSHGLGKLVQPEAANNPLPQKVSSVSQHPFDSLACLFEFFIDALLMGQFDVGVQADEALRSLQILVILFRGSSNSVFGLFCSSGSC